VPDCFLKQLQAAFRAHAVGSFILLREMLHLLDRFEADGITVVPFKGQALAASIYGSALLRQAGDLDFIVHPREMHRAMALLRSLRYTSLVESAAPEEAERHRSPFHHSFQRENPRVKVELHWRFAPDHFPFALDLTPLWERLDSFLLEGTRVLTLPPEELLLSLCVHGARHRWERLIWVCDIAALIHSRPELEWPRVLELAGRLRCERVLAVGLLLAHALLEIALPVDLLQRARADRVALSLAADVPEWLFQETTDLPTRWKWYCFQLLSRKHPWDRLRYGGYLAQLWITPNEEDRAWLPLPAALSFLHVLLRPVRVATTYPWRRRREG
jgi:hypothetical protein